MLGGAPDKQYRARCTVHQLNESDEILFQSLGKVFRSVDIDVRYHLIDHYLLIDVLKLHGNVDRLVGTSYTVMVERLVQIIDRRRKRKRLESIDVVNIICMLGKFGPAVYQESCYKNDLTNL